MRKKLLIPFLIILLVALAACGDKKEENENSGNDLNDEVLNLNVAFDLPEKIEVGETLKFEAIVTYGDDKVTDADEVNFEYWEEGNKDDSITIDSTNNGDGTYTAEVTINEDAVISVYAHTTAEGLHTMPLRTVIVGDAVSEAEDGDAHEHVEGFHMHFMEPEDVVADDEVELVVHLEMHDDPFEKADVRYEIWNEDTPDKRDWIDTEEIVAGEYSASHVFTEPGTYSIQIHVEDDDDLHEHETYEVEVSE